MQGLRRLYYIVSVYTYNVYYVTRALIYFYDTYIIDFILSALTGIMRGQALKPYISRVLAVAVLIF